MGFLKRGNSGRIKYSRVTLVKINEFSFLEPSEMLLSEESYTSSWICLCPCKATCQTSAGIYERKMFFMKEAAVKLKNWVKEM